MKWENPTLQLVFFLRLTTLAGIKAEDRDLDPCRPLQDRARQHGDERQLVPGQGGGDRHEPAPPALLFRLHQLDEPGGGGQPVRQRPAGQLEPHGRPQT